MVYSKWSVRKNTKLMPYTTCHISPPPISHPMMNKSGEKIVIVTLDSFSLSLCCSHSLWNNPIRIRLSCSFISNTHSSPAHATCPPMRPPTLWCLYVACIPFNFMPARSSVKNKNKKMWMLAKSAGCSVLTRIYHSSIEYKGRECCRRYGARFGRNCTPGK